MKLTHTSFLLSLLYYLPVLSMMGHYWLMISHSQTYINETNKLLGQGMQRGCSMWSIKNNYHKYCRFKGKLWHIILLNKYLIKLNVLVQIMYTLCCNIQKLSREMTRWSQKPKNLLWFKIYSNSYTSNNDHNIVWTTLKSTWSMGKVEYCNVIFSSAGNGFCLAMEGWVYPKHWQAHPM